MKAQRTLCHSVMTAKDRKFENLLHRAAVLLNSRSSDLGQDRMQRNIMWPALDKLEKPVHQDLSGDSGRIISEWDVRPLREYPLLSSCFAHIAGSSVLLRRHAKLEAKRKS